MSIGHGRVLGGTCVAVAALLSGAGPAARAGEDDAERITAYEQGDPDGEYHVALWLVPRAGAVDVVLKNDSPHRDEGAPLEAERELTPEQLERLRKLVETAVERADAAEEGSGSERVGEVGEDAADGPFTRLPLVVSFAPDRVSLTTITYEEREEDGTQVHDFGVTFPRPGSSGYGPEDEEALRRFRDAVGAALRATG